MYHWIMKETTEQRRERWETIAKDALGKVSQLPLVKELLRWIADDDLGASLEAAGLVHPVYCKVVTTDDILEKTMDAYVLASKR